MKLYDPTTYFQNFFYKINSATAELQLYEYSIHNF